MSAARTSRTTLGPPPPRSWGPIGPTHLFGHVPMWVIHLPSFGPIGPKTMAADLPLALGLAARPLGEVLEHTYTHTLPHI